MTLPPSPALPGLPVVISATAVSNTEIDVTVTYTGPPAAATYTFSFSTNRSGPYSTVTQASATYIHSGLAPNTKVYYFANVMTAENPVRTSQNSLQVSATTFSVATAATPTFSPVSGTYTTPIPFTISCATPGASIYYTLTFAAGSGTTPVPGQPGTTLYTVPINDAALGPLVVNAIATAPGFTQSAVGTVSYTATPPVSGVAFPRVALQLFDGQQLPRTDANIKGLASYSMLIMGGDFNGAINAPFSRDYITKGLKSYIGSDSLHTKAPIVVQYEITNYNNPNTPEFNTAVANNNWWVRSAWPGGSINGAPSNQQINYIPYNTDGATGLTTGQWDAQYMTDRYMANRSGSLATSTSFASFGSTSLDGVMKDNQSYPQLDGDWRHLGSSQSSSDQTVFDLFWNGIKQYATKFRALNPGKLCMGNTSWAYAQFHKSPVFTGTSPVGVFDYPMQQFCVGRTSQGIFTYTGWAGSNDTSWGWYTTQMNSSANGSCLITGAFQPTEFALLGSSLCMTLMKDGYLTPGLVVGSDPNQDYVDGNNPATWPAWDELFGGTLRNNAYLGHNLSTAQGQQQTAPWSNGVYRRDFDNGIVLWNPSGAPQTVNLGGTFWHIKSLYGSQAINDGTSVTGNYTIPGGSASNSANDRCGVVFVRTQPPAS